MAVSPVARLAASGPAPVFVLEGDRMPAAAPLLPLEPRLEIVSSPRHASVLLAAGTIPEGLREEAARVHDQLPHPRAVALWSDDADDPAPFRDPARVAAGDDPAPTIAALHRALLLGERPSASPLGPEDNPVRWRGVGPHGQGGEGMMGGRPYGRKMAMTGDDLRDGLSLDRVPLTLGPFLSWLPPGLSLELELQGDVVQTLELRVPAALRGHAASVFERAAAGPVPIAELERARASHHLCATARLLRLHDLDALAHRTLCLARDPEAGGAARVRALSRALRRTGALALATRGVGVIDDRWRAEGLGPTARSAGRREDARLEDPSYEGLGFAPLVHRAGDAEARWRQWLDEAAQALELAERAGDRTREPGPPLEGPRGPTGVDGERGARWRELVPAVAVGQAFDSLATALVSLDLDASALPVDGRGGDHDDEGDDGGRDGGADHGGRDAESDDAGPGVGRPGDSEGRG